MARAETRKCGVGQGPPFTFGPRELNLIMIETTDHRVCRHFVPRYCSLGSGTSSHRAGGATSVVEPIHARVAQCKNCHNLSA